MVTEMEGFAGDTLEIIDRGPQCYTNLTLDIGLRSFRTLW